MNKLKGERKFAIIKSHRELEEAIKKNCYDCMGHQKKIDCELEKCPLYRFRPWSKGRNSQ